MEMSIGHVHLKTRDPKATSQFYINQADNSQGLDRSSRDAGYAVFGRVTDGMDLVDKIANMRTIRRRAADGQPLTNLPAEPVVIKSIRRKAKG